MTLRRPIPLVCALALALAAPVWAQRGALRVQLEVDRTDHRIERAELVVGVASSEQARFELSEARRMQEDARRALAAGRPRIALDLTLRARGHADRAVTLGGGLPDPDRVQEQLQRTGELIDRARPLVGDCREPRAVGSMREAAEMQRRAENAGIAGRYLAALQLTLGARDRVRQALRACHIAEDDRDSAERALRRTADLIQRAQDRLAAGGSDDARQALDNAIETQKRAEQELHDGRPEPSMRLTLAARVSALRALRMTGGF